MKDIVGRAGTFLVLVGILGLFLFGVEKRNQRNYEISDNNLRARLTCLELNYDDGYAEKIGEEFIYICQDLVVLPENIWKDD